MTQGELERVLADLIDERDWTTANQVADLLEKLRRLGAMPQAQGRGGMPSPSPESLRTHPTHGGFGLAAVGKPVPAGDYL